MSADGARPDALVGAWTLLDFVARAPDGRPPKYPFGEAPVGRILYTADGFVSAHLARRERPPLAPKGMEAAWRTDEAARAAAFDATLAYTGRWHVEGDEVCHQIELAQVPDVVGTTQRRRFDLEHETLTLSYMVAGRSGRDWQYVLRWRRVDTCRR